MPVSTVVVGKTSEKPALVLVHGLGSAGTIWKSLYEELQDHFHIYPLDLPGHGEAALQDEPLDPRSLADAIAMMMESEHRITEFHVAGNSLGGWIALELAAAYPDRIKASQRLRLLVCGEKGQLRNSHRACSLGSWQSALNIFYGLLIICHH